MARSDHMIEPQVREAIGHFTARVRHDVDVHAEDVSAELMRLFEEREVYWRSELERVAGQTRAEVERTFPARIETLRRAWTRGLAPAGVAEPDLRVADDPTGPGVPDAQLDVLGRLLGAVRRIDDAATLTSILEALASGTAAEANRAAIMLVDGDMLRTWKHHGFSAAAPADMPIAQARFVTAAMALRQTVFVPSVGAPDPASPAFMHVPVGHTGLVAPIVVGTEVVAVLYADDVGRTLTQEEAPAWTDVVELLVRYASVRLENVTSIQTVDLLTQPA